MERNSENKMTGRNPKVFISYSWENKENKEWARELADKLLENGIDAYIDQYDLSLGDRLPQQNCFLEKMNVFPYIYYWICWLLNGVLLVRRHQIDLWNNRLLGKFL